MYAFSVEPPNWLCSLPGKIGLTEESLKSNARLNESFLRVGKREVALIVIILDLRFLLLILLFLFAFLPLLPFLLVLLLLFPLLLLLSLLFPCLLSRLWLLWLSNFQTTFCILCFFLLFNLFFSHEFLRVELFFEDRHRLFFELLRHFKVPLPFF